MRSGNMYGWGWQYGPGAGQQHGKAGHGGKAAQGGKGTAHSHDTQEEHGGRGGHAGQGAQPDSAESTITVTAEYDDAAIAELLFMIEEEKLAGDIYEAFYDLYGTKIFDNIAQSEENHFDALLAQAELLGLDVDAFVFNEAGTFEDPELQELYDTLLAQGSASLEDALAVGVAIEERDMVDIAEAAEMVEGTPLADVYANLLAGSANHLQAFESLL